MNDKDVIQGLRFLCAQAARELTEHNREYHYCTDEDFIAELKAAAGPIADEVLHSRGHFDSAGRFS